MEKIQLTKSQKILFAVLGVVLAYAIFDFVSNRDTYINFYTGKNAQNNNATSVATKSENRLTEDPLKISLTSTWGDDPFLIKVKKKIVKKSSRKRIKEPTFVLKGISYRPDEGSVALINDRILKLGDVIEGYKVIKIEEKKVVLWNGKKRKILRLTNI